MSKHLTEDEKKRIKAELAMWEEFAKLNGFWLLYTHYRKPTGHVQRLRKGEVQAVPAKEARRLVATTCVVMDRSNVVARGACVVSDTDTPYKLDGRMRAVKAAMIAYHIKLPDLRRLGRNGAKDIDAPIYRSELTPRLTSVESSRIENRRLAAQQRKEQHKHASDCADHDNEPAYPTSY